MKKIDITEEQLNRIVLFAEAFREKFNKVTIITLKEHYKAKIRNNVLRQFAAEHDFDATDEIDGIINRQIREKMDTGTVFVFEYVKVLENRDVEICIDVAEITDATEQYALQKLLEVDIKPDMNFRLGENKTFKSYEIFQS